MLVVVVVQAWSGNCLDFAGGGALCNRSRQVLTGSWGIITDGSGPYPEASHCQWLIRGELEILIFYYNSGVLFIILEVRFAGIEKN